MFSVLCGTFSPQCVRERECGGEWLRQKSTIWHPNGLKIITSLIAPDRDDAATSANSCSYVSITPANTTTTGLPLLLSPSPLISALPLRSSLFCHEINLLLPSVLSASHSPRFIFIAFWVPCIISSTFPAADSRFLSRREPICIRLNWNTRVSGVSRALINWEALSCNPALSPPPVLTLWSREDAVTD